MKNPIEKYFKNKGKWISDCVLYGSRAMTVCVSFTTEESEDDSVEFSITPFNKEELNELFNVFIQENHWKNVIVHEVRIVRSASSMDALVKMEEEMGIF